MTDPNPDLPTDPTNGIIKIPEQSREHLRDFIETQNPQAFENFLNGLMVEVSVLEQKSHSGPIPSPGDLREYEMVLPGLAERIVRLAERPAEEYSEERKHRHSIEKSLSDHSRHYRYIGLAMGYSIAFACIGAAIWSASRGDVPAALIFLGLPLVGLVGNFIRGTVAVKIADDPKSPD